MVRANENLGDGDIWAGNSGQKMVSAEKMWNIRGKPAVTFQSLLLS
jgi:hypothetical protein